MSEENSSMSNRDTQPTMNQNTGAPGATGTTGAPGATGALSLSSHGSGGESGESIAKSFDNSNMLKSEKSISDNYIEKEHLQVELSGKQNNS